MNYIKQINAFYDQQEFNPLSSAAVSLWHGLMHINNKTRWMEEFSAPMGILGAKTGLSESGVRKARKELVEKGYLVFTSRAGNQAPIYEILPLYEEDGSPVGKEDDNSEDKSDGSRNGNRSGSSNTLIKQKEKKENEEEDTRVNNAHHFYENNLGMLSPFIAESITKWTGELSEDLVVESLRLAVSNNKPFFSYAEAILKQWQRTGVRSIVQIPKGQEKQKKPVNLFDKLRKEVQA